MSRPSLGSPGVRQEGWELRPGPQRWLPTRGTGEEESWNLQAGIWLGGRGLGKKGESRDAWRRGGPALNVQNQSLAQTPLHRTQAPLPVVRVGVPLSYSPRERNQAWGGKICEALWRWGIAVFPHCPLTFTQAFS